jgi:hypothetical protein
LAKKKLSRDQKRKQKKQKRAQRQPSAAPLDPTGVMMQRLKKAGLDRYEVMRNPPGHEKMSEVLMDFIRPYRHIATTTEVMHKLITTALVAWNTALLPEEEQAARLQEVAKIFPDEAVEDFYASVREMMARKRKYFAEYDRTILDYELVDRGDDYHISVVSFMPTGKKEEE